MIQHAALAESMGLDRSHILVCEDGDQIEVSDKGIRRVGQIPAGFHYIDGGSGDLDERPLEERRMLAEYGVLMISAGIDGERGEIVHEVTITTRGWFEGGGDRSVQQVITNEVRSALTEALREGERDAETLNRVAQRCAGRLLGQRFRRQPVLLPAIVVF
jgi:ribonuclease J